MGLGDPQGCKGELARGRVVWGLSQFAFQVKTPGPARPPLPSALTDTVRPILAGSLAPSAPGLSVLAQLHLAKGHMPVVKTTASASPHPREGWLALFPCFKAQNTLSGSPLELLLSAQEQGRLVDTAKMSTSLHRERLWC